VLKEYFDDFVTYLNDILIYSRQSWDTLSMQDSRQAKKKTLYVWKS